jgi:hypothetical protein
MTGLASLMYLLASSFLYTKVSASCWVEMLEMLRDWNHTVRLTYLSDDVNRKFEYILQTVVLKRLAHTRQNSYYADGTLISVYCKGLCCVRLSTCRQCPSGSRKKPNRSEPHQVSHRPVVLFSPVMPFGIILLILFFICYNFWGPERVNPFQPKKSVAYEEQN